MATGLQLVEVRVAHFQLKSNILEQDIVLLEDVPQRVSSLLLLFICVQELSLLREVEGYGRLIGDPSLQRSE